MRQRRLALTWDDWLLVPSYVSTIGICAIALNMHHWETMGNPPGLEPIIDVELLEPILKSIFALLQLLLPAYAFTRYSILALYLRVFTGRSIRLLSYFMIAFITAQWISFALASTLQCNPVSHYWDKTISGVCVDINKFNRSFTPVNVSADTIILLLPLPSIWRLKLSRTRKVGITFVFGLGTAALIASILRLAELELNTTIIIAPNYTNAIVTWLVVEPSLYFITACLPTMGPLLRLLVPYPVRQFARERIDGHEQASASKLGYSHGQSATHLVSSNDGLSALPPLPQAMTGHAATTHANARSLSLAEMGQHLAKNEPDVPLQDLNKIQTGHGIMMTTEVMVTEEERVGDVLGL